MADHPEATITITGCEEFRSGTSASGKDWTLYDIKANNAQGQPIAAKLRCFKNLPLGQTIDVQMEDRSTEQYGAEYTIHFKGQSVPRQQQSGEAVSAGLEERVKVLEARVAKLEGKQEIPF